MQPGGKARRHRHAAPDRRAERSPPGVGARWPRPPLLVVIAWLARQGLYAQGFSTGRVLRKASGIRPPSAPAKAERIAPASTRRRLGASFLRCQMSKVPSRMLKGTAEN